VEVKTRHEKRVNGAEMPFRGLAEPRHEGYVRDCQIVKLLRHGILRKQPKGVIGAGENVDAYLYNIDENTRD
jgi:hypothetical protein